MDAHLTVSRCVAAFVTLCRLYVRFNLDRFFDGDGAAEAYFGTSAAPLGRPAAVELLMLALPHHRDALTPTAESTNAFVVEEGGCTPTLHGEACATVGSVWTMTEPLSNVSFYAPQVEGAQGLEGASISCTALCHPPKRPHEVD